MSPFLVDPLSSESTDQDFHNSLVGSGLPFIVSSSALSSVQFSCSVVSDSLRPHESQNARPPCSSPTPGVYSNSCLSSWWCHPAISSSVVPFSSCPQSLPASESFLMNQVFALGGPSTGVSASASVLPMSTLLCNKRILKTSCKCLVFPRVHEELNSC